MTRQSTVSFRDKVYKQIIDLQAELVQSTKTTWGTSQIINLVCVYAFKKGMTPKDLQKLKAELN